MLPHAQQQRQQQQQQGVLPRSQQQQQQQQQQQGVAPVQLHYYASEQALLQGFCAVVQAADPDVLVGWDLQLGSLGYLADRGAALGFNLLRAASRTPEVGRV
jgi:DNA polymerase zeta